MLKNSKKHAADTSNSESSLTMINYPDIEEGRSCEFTDFLLAAIECYDKSVPEGCRRKKQIAQAFMRTNSISNYEANMIADVKKCFRNGDNLISTLEKYNIKCVRKNKHFVFEYCGITLTLSCTPSDCRSKENELSHLKRGYCVVV